MMSPPVLSLCVPPVMSLSGPGLAVAASPCVPEQFPPSAFTLTTLLELRSPAHFYTAQLENALKYFCVCVRVGSWKSMYLRVEILSTVHR